MCQSFASGKAYDIYRRETITWEGTGHPSPSPFCSAVLQCIRKIDSVLEKSSCEKEIGPKSEDDTVGFLFMGKAGKPWHLITKIII